VVVLGAVVAVLGAGLVVLGVNGWAGARPRAGGGADPHDKGRRPVPGVGSEVRSSPAGRRIVATAWLVLGVLFIVAAFSHQVP
jgi:xanthine/uracil permease